MTDNVYEFIDSNTIEREAREWLIRLDGDTPLNNSEVEALHEWINRSSAHKQELERLSHFWKSTNVLTELAIPLEKPSKTRIFLNGSGFSQVFRIRIVWASAISVLLLTLSASVWLYQTNEMNTNGFHVTEIGQQKKLALTDDSTLQLNTDSQVLVDYEDTIRKVHLLRGEAHFDVAHNPAIPFEVYAGNNRIRVLGTAFTVHLQDKKSVKVTVTEGKVNLGTIAPEISTGREHNDLSEITPAVHVLSAGQSAVLNESKNEIAELAEIEIERQLSWREGLLVFTGESLVDAIKEVNRYTPVTIEIIDPELNNLRIGGRFKSSDLDAIFEVLETNFDIKVTRITDMRIHLALNN